MQSRCLRCITVFIIRIHNVGNACKIDGVISGGGSWKQQPVGPSETQQRPRTEHRAKQLLRAPGARDDDDVDNDYDDDGDGEDLAGLNTHTHTQAQTRLDEETAAGPSV